MPSSDLPSLAGADCGVPWVLASELLQTVHDAFVMEPRSDLVATFDDDAFESEWMSWREETKGDIGQRGDFGPGDVSPAIRTRIDELVNARWSDSNALRVRREIAHLIDDLWHAEFVSYFAEFEADRSILDLEAGNPYPVTWPDLRQDGKTVKLASPPDRLVDRPWETPHIRFWSTTPGHRIQLQIDFSDVTERAKLALGNDVRRIATLHPYNTAWPVCWPKHKMGDYHVKPGPAKTGRPRPTDENDASSLAQWVSDVIASPPWGQHTDRDASIALIPEYCMTAKHADALADSAVADKQSTWPAIMVPGSWWMRRPVRDDEWKPDDDSGTAPDLEYTNRYEVWFRSPSSNQYDRSSTFEKQFPLGGESMKRKGPATFRLFQIGHMRLAVGLCRDLLHPDLAYLLGRAGVNLVLAVANTTSTEVFRKMIEGISGVTQAIGAVANSPSRHPGWDFEKRHPHDKGKKCCEQIKEDDVAWKPNADLAVYSHPAIGDATYRVGTAAGQSKYFDQHAWVTWFDELGNDPHVSREPYDKLSDFKYNDCCNPTEGDDD